MRKQEPLSRTKAASWKRISWGAEGRRELVVAERTGHLKKKKKSSRKASGQRKGTDSKTAYAEGKNNKCNQQ